MPGDKSPRARTQSFIRALPPDDLDAYEALKREGFTYDHCDGWWYAARTKARVLFLLASGYRRVD